MRERYLKTKEDVRALRDRLNSGKWTIDPYWSFDMKVTCGQCGAVYRTTKIY